MIPLSFSAWRDNQEQKKKMGRLTSWTSARQNQPKRLTNNNNKIVLVLKLSVSQKTFGRQLSEINFDSYPFLKLVLNVRKHLNTARYR